VVWTVAAVLLWLVAEVIDRRTEVRIHSFGRSIDIEVAGTSLSAPIAFEDLTAIEIRAMDSIDPPGGGRIVVTGDGGTIIDQRLPRRFRFSTAGIHPTGDWELDDFAASGTVWKRSLLATGNFSIDAVLRGRFHHDLTLALDGDPPISCAIRRGLINNDCFVRATEANTFPYKSLRKDGPGHDFTAKSSTAPCACTWPGS